MSDCSARGRHGGRRRRAAIAVAAVAAVSLTGLAGAPSVSHAQPADAIQNISVQIGPSAAVTAITTSTVPKDATAGPGEVVALDPTTDGANLPMRVQTLWYAGGETGTNLASLTGRDGRIVIDVMVENLTVTAQQATVESKGSKYRKYGLAGVPLTVTASARLDGVGLGQVAVPGQERPDGAGGVTNGIASVQTGATVVQWAGLTAAPVLPSVLVFRLAVDATDFVPPAFDIMVQPGLNADNSIEGLLAASSGDDSEASQSRADAVKLVVGVSAEISKSQQLVDRVHASLAKDASELGSKTYSELKAGSAAILSQIDETKTRLDALKAQTASSITGAQGDLSQDLTRLVDHLNNDVLGTTTGPLETTPTVIDGCSITLPDLAPGSPDTVASAVRLVQEQVGALAAAFTADDSDAATATGDTAAARQNCRDAIVAHLAETLGTPDQTCSPNSTSVRCAISDARNALAADADGLAGLESDLNSWVDGLGATDLAVGAARLSTALGGITSALDGLAQASDDAAGDANAVAAAVSSAQEQVQGLRAVIEEAKDADVIEGVSLSREAHNAKDAVADATDAVSRASSILNSAGQPVGLPAGWQSDAIAIVGQAVSADPLCPQDWAASLGGGSSVTAMSSALEVVADTEECDAAATAGLVARLVRSADADRRLAASVVGTSGPDPSVASLLNGAGDDLDTAGRSLQNLDTALPTIEEKLEATEELLNSLYIPPEDGAQAAGTLATMDDAAKNLQTAFSQDEEGSVAELTARIRETMNGIYTGSVTPGQACPVASGTIPAAAADAIFSLSDHILCQTGDSRDSLSAWFTAADENRVGLAAALDAAAARTDTAAGTATSDVDLMSGSLTSQLRDKTISITKANLAAVEAAKAGNSSDATRLEEAFSASTDATVTGLIAQVDSANRDAAAARSGLSADFAAILANLGVPDPDSRAGLLGKLWSTSALTGDTAMVIRTVIDQTQAYSATTSSQIVGSRLDAALLRAGLDRSLPAFPGPSNGAGVAATVYSIHVSER